MKLIVGMALGLTLGLFTSVAADFQSDWNQQQMLYEQRKQTRALEQMQFDQQMRNLNPQRPC